LTISEGSLTITEINKDENTYFEVKLQYIVLNTNSVIFEILGRMNDNVIIQVNTTILQQFLLQNKLAMHQDSCNSFEFLFLSK